MKRRIQVPTSFTLRGRKWTVKWGADIWGEASHAHQEILMLCDGESELRQLEIWIHELLHAAFPPGIVSNRVEEQIVHGWARDLAPIIRITIEELVASKLDKRRGKR